MESRCRTLSGTLLNSYPEIRSSRSRGKWWNILRASTTV
jgi:hypothetical protein